MAELVGNTTAGAVRGVAIDEGVVFKGIPFAAAPTGERRYLPPAPPAPWDGVRECKEFGPVCPQTQFADLGSVMGNLCTAEPTDEDCLFLNVWTPSVDDLRRPTMVWIHGGAFSAGSGSQNLFDGASFARDGVVMVSINYRLHTFGFLYLDELFEGAEGTGNLGLLDQMAALRWVQENIAAFGGDPDNVTVFGESAGGMSVAALMATPAAKGLFRRGIAQSGAGHNNLSRENAGRVASRALELLEVKPGDWAALRAVPAERMVEVATIISRREANSLLRDDVTGLPFQPVMDGIVQSDHPIGPVAEGSAPGIDLLLGTCAEEWRAMIWGMPEAIQQFIPDPDISSYLAGSDHDVEEVLDLYSKDRPGQTRRELLAAVVTDGMFTIPAIRFAEAQLAHHPNVHMYRFSWRPPVQGGMMGAGHMVELPFVFDDLGNAADLVGPNPPMALAAAIHSSWVRFAATGDPNGGDLPQWPTYDADRRPVMDFDTTSEVVDDPGSSERRLWDDLL